jgi:type I restriction enzyme S subunit
MLPSGWQRKTISEILDKVSTPVDIVATEKYCEIGIRSHAKGIFHKEPITGKSLGNKRVFHIVPNCFVVNIVFAWEQAVAKTTVNELGMIASHRFPMFKPKAEKCDIDYILYLFKTAHGKHLLGLASPGGAGRNKTLGQSEFAKLTVSLPPIKEQLKIAKILMTWDLAIEATEKLINNSKKQRKALIQKLLTGKQRIAGFNGEWTFSRFEEIFKVANDKKMQIKSSDYSETGFTPIIDQGQKAVAAYTNTNIVYKDIPVIIFGDHTKIVKWVDFPFALGADGTQVIKTKSQLNVKFGYYLISNATLPNLGYSRHMGALKEKEFKYPVSLDEQEKIVAILTIADREIETLQQKHQLLNYEKKALMQQLVTGKKRVSIN